MRRIASQPLAWMLLNAALALTLLQATGRFQAFEDPDTDSYRTMPLGSLRGALSHHRTIGYPLFLKGVRAVTGTDRSAPYFQFLIYFLAVAAFGLALRSVGFSPGATGAAACVLLWSHAVFDFTGFMHPDLLAVSGAIFAMAALIVALRPKASWGVWVGLAAAIFATVQIRPAYLFLPPLVPVLGLALALFVFRVPLTRRSGVRLFAVLTTAAAAPLLAFCGLRWLVVGDFGLVSFGGYNLIGITAQFLDEDLLPKLSPEVRPLAAAILRRREAHAQWAPPANYWDIEHRYANVIWEISIPAAKELYGDDAVQTNRAIMQLSREVIRLRPDRYLRWLAASGREGMRNLLLLFITDKGTRLALLVLLATQAIVLTRHFRTGWLPAPQPASQQRFLEVNTLLWLALGFAIPKLVLVILVETPIHRYLNGAVVFAPALMGVLAYHRFRQVFPSPARADSLSSAEE